MGESDAVGLLGHGAADFGNTMADADDCGLAGGVEVTAAVGGDDPATFTTNSDGIIFAKIAGKKRGRVDGGAHWKIVAEAVKRREKSGTAGRAKLDENGEGMGYFFAGLEDEA